MREKRLGLLAQKIIEQIKEKDISRTELAKINKVAKNLINWHIGSLRHNFGFVQIKTNYSRTKKGKWDIKYHWLKEEDSIQEYIELINSRTKKAMKQNKFSNKTNLKSLELTYKNKEVLKIVQNTQENKANSAMLE